MLKHFQATYRLDSNYLNKTFLIRLQGYDKSLMKPLRFDIFVIDP